MIFAHLISQLFLGRKLLGEFFFFTANKHVNSQSDQSSLSVPEFILERVLCADAGLPSSSRGPAAGQVLGVPGPAGQVDRLLRWHWDRRADRGCRERAREEKNVSSLWLQSFLWPLPAPITQRWPSSRTGWVLPNLLCVWIPANIPLLSEHWVLNATVAQRLGSVCARVRPCAYFIVKTTLDRITKKIFTAGTSWFPFFWTHKASIKFLQWGLKFRGELCSEANDNSSCIIASVCVCVCLSKILRNFKEHSGFDETC